MNYTLYVQKLSKTRSPINTAIIENMNIYQTLKHSNYRIAVQACSKSPRQALFFPHSHKQNTHTKTSKFINYQSKPQQQRSQAKNRCIVLFQICNVECSFVEITNDTKYRTFCFFPQVDRTENFASKMASLFRPVWRKKNLFSYALQTLALKYIHLYALLSTYLSGEHSKKTCQASEKNPSKPRFSGPFYILSHFPSFSLLLPNSISSGNENKHLVS